MKKLSVITLLLLLAGTASAQSIFSNKKEKFAGQSMKPENCAATYAGHNRKSGKKTIDFFNVNEDKGVKVKKATSI